MPVCRQSWESLCQRFQASLSYILFNQKFTSRLTYWVRPTFIWKMVGEWYGFLSAISTLRAKARVLFCFFKRGSDFTTAAHRGQGGRVSPWVPSELLKTEKIKQLNKRLVALMAGAAAKGCWSPPHPAPHLPSQGRLGGLWVLTAWEVSS